ncbi:MAG TPA: PIG-L family deacetylase [Anaerolineales bacterium]|nr:PIG-L family deacetylase [Anaerolineales bacterium]
MNGKLRLLAVFPHPDDETLGLGSTLARYSAEGVETYLVCATRGERGWYDSEGPDPGFEEVARIRQAELRCAAERLGLHEVCFLDHIDGDVDQADPQEIIAKIASHIRRIQPQVVVTFSPDGAYGHPDHIALSQFTNGALVCAADGSFEDEQAPHRVSKFYYMVDSMNVVQAANEAFGGISMEIDGVVRSHVGWQDWQITTWLDNHRYMGKVRDAIRCHKSQLAGYGPIAEWPVDELSKVFGVGHFYRAFSLVNSGRKVETDLFEGLRVSS